MAKILFLDDEPSVGLLLADTLTSAGHQVVGARSVVEALQALGHQTIDLVISRFRIPGLTGPELLSLLRREGYDVPVIMMTSGDGADEAADAIEAGAAGYVPSPIRPRELRLAVERALDHAQLRRSNDMLHRDLVLQRSARTIVSTSPAMQRLLHAIAAVSPGRTTVVLEGEAGSGHELLARAIHDMGERRGRPFVSINCSAIPEGFQESALFGHERGALPGATRRMAGAFEQANGGTVFLDEVAALRPHVRASLLRALDAMEVQRVGGSTALAVDVRVVLGSTTPLRDLADSGALDQAFGSMLGTVTIGIPALRDRREDIPMLALQFARSAALEVGKEVRDIAPDALQVLQSYAWPGNVGELRHVMERAVILTHEPTLQAHLFEQQAQAGTRSLVEQVLQRATPTSLAALNVGQPAPSRGIVLHTLNVDEAERALIRRALEVTGGNRTRTAQLLGISVRTLRNKLNGPQRAGARVE